MSRLLPEKTRVWLIRLGEAVVVLFFSVGFTFFFPVEEYAGTHSLSEIRSEGRLHIGTIMNPIEYHVHQGKVDGFSYELGCILADSLEVEPVFHVYHTFEDACMALLQNDIDLMAVAEESSAELEAFFSFTRPLLKSDVVCLRHRAKDADSVTDFGYVPSPAFLQHAARIKKLHPDWRMHQYRAASYLLLEEMEKNDCPDVTLELGVCWKAYAALFPHLELVETLPGTVRLRWAVRKGNDSLCNAVNGFLKVFETKKEYARLLKKHTNPLSAHRISISSQKIPFGSISRYDDLLEKYGGKYNVDWQLIAALIYQESRFYAHTVGSGNTIGLMQFAPATAARFGVSQGASPERQIEGGCRYVAWLDRAMRKEGVEDSMQRVPMVVAAYNAGSGHLSDAVALARYVEGLDPTHWEGGVKEALMLLGDRKYNRLPVVRNGSYYGGRHTLRYVKSVLDRTAHYQAVVSRDSLVEIK